MNQKIIKIEKLSKTYATKQGEILHAIKDIDLVVEKGEVYGVIGMSGAGKSTLIRCMTMIEKPTHGKIFIDQQEITQLEGRGLRIARQNIGMIFQHFNLFSSRTVRENVEYPLEIIGLKADLRKKRSRELLELVDLVNKENSYPAQLSGGQKQRVAIARALANYPKVLFCDEATSALDPKSTHSILELLAQLNKQLGLTIVLITHEMEVVKTICHRVAVLEKGEIVEQGKTIDLFSNPHHPITKHFLQHMIHDLPEEFAFANQGKRLFRICFRGDKARKPIISQLIREVGVDINILLGSIDHLQTNIVGNLVVEISGKPIEIASAQSYLAEQGISCEEI